MRRFIVNLLAVIGGLTVLGAIVIGIIFLIAVALRPGVPPKTILEVNFETQLVEYVPDDPVAAVIMAKQPTLRDLIDALDRAAGDDRVVGLVARIGAPTLGMAQVQEIRDAILRFRSKNKFAIAFSETFGEVGPGSSSYYLATAFEQIWLQPSGDIGLTGVIAESPFIRGTLDKLGIVPKMDHRYEYKNAMNFFTEKKFTPPHREATEKLMSSWYWQMVRGIAQGRKLSEDKVRELIDRGPLIGKEALEAGLVDGMAYRDEIYSKAKERAGEGAQMLYLSKYLERAGRPHQSGKKVALIYGVGGVQRGKSGFDPLSGQVTMGSDTVTAAFRAAIEDKDVRAIIFRIDSPGGSYVASDAIWREVVRARQSGKPVIATMGDVAGSGGYFVAMAADRIVAQPGTITGSIGVLGGKMLTSGFWDKLGISWDEVHAGANATMWTGIRDYSPAEWARFQTWLDRVYEDFTNKVAEGRKLQKEHVLKIAKGRIWSGEDAKALGLVDELGGLDVAIKLAKQAAGIPEKEDIRLELYPAKKGLLATLLKEEPESGERDATAEALVRTLRAIQPAARRLKAITGARGILEMPPLEIRH
jgi:protease-4